MDEEILYTIVTHNSQLSSSHVYLKGQKSTKNRRSAVQKTIYYSFLNLGVV